MTDTLETPPTHRLAHAPEGAPDPIPPAPVGALGTGLGITVTEVTLTREQV